jgi:hypothetical protein
MKTKHFLSTTLIVSFFAFGFLQGCEDKKQAAEIEKLKAELTKQAIEREARAVERNAKSDLEKNPGKYIFSVGGCTHTESGILNVYTNIQACNFVNQAIFPVNNISGNLHVTATNGTKAIPFKASGSLGAGQTNMLPIVGIQKMQIPGRFVSSKIEVLKVTVTGN